ERNKPIQLGEQLAGEKSVVDGAVCLLAPWSETFGDLVLTPLGRMRGACLHANLMLTLASGRMLYVLTGTKVGFLEPFLLLLLLILIAWLLTWTDLRIAATVAVLIPICFFLASFEIFSNWGLILRTSTPVTALGFLVFIGTVARFIIEQKDRRRIKRLFSRYVAPNVVSEILRNADMLNMKGKKVEATVLFLDICGFTSFSESHAPEEVFKKLNTYLDMIVAAILESGGTLDKFIGDAVMAVFGAPIPMKDHPEKAVRCALDIRDRLDRYNRSLGADEAPFRIRIGLNSGFCVAGNVGTDARSEYTVIGDTVNLASRLESSASPQEIIISETTYSFLVGVFKIEERPPIKLKGKSQPQKTFKVLG
ncbi:MAG: adenylate/guanylate cyclase domain-containing protein, partial [bacterium]|nr:adenylate/guanylate cyclase domain-containing protein [bacterium]